MKNAMLWTLALIWPCLNSYAQQQKPAEAQKGAAQQQPKAQKQLDQAKQNNADDPCKKPLDQKLVDEAIKKGCANLLDQIDSILPGQPPQQGKKRVAAVQRHTTAELVLLTLIHGGAFSEKNEKCKKLLDYVLDQKPVYTYNAVLKAMALKELNKSKYIEFIAEVGQFLVDTQSTEGNWTYSGGSSGLNTGSGPKIRDSAPGDKTATGLSLRKGTPRGNHGDNSNTQYAALGLRAVHDSGIEIPKETLELAKKWWEKSQFPNGSWHYNQAGGGLGKTTAEAAPPNTGRRPITLDPLRTSAMSAGGISSLAIYSFLLGEAKKKEDFMKNASIAGGIKWLSQDFDNAMQSRPDPYWANLYLAYSIERAGILAEFQKLGEHDWYKHGAHMLIAAQQADGSWKDAFIAAVPPASTCFAILFLKKATEPLIDTGDKFIDNAPPQNSDDEKK